VVGAGPKGALLVADERSRPPTSPVSSCSWRCSLDLEGAHARSCAPRRRRSRGAIQRLVVVARNLAMKTAPSRRTDASVAGWKTVGMPSLRFLELCVPPLSAPAAAISIRRTHGPGVDRSAGISNRFLGYHRGSESQGIDGRTGASNRGRRPWRVDIVARQGGTRDRAARPEGGYASGLTKAWTELSGHVGHVPTGGSHRGA